MKRLALVAITAYQRYLSPYKGFHCAYRTHTGHASCSALGFRAIRLYGIFHGIQVLRGRMYRCGVAHRRFSGNLRRPPLKQRGDCDVGGCDLPSFDSACDLPSGKSLSKFCDAVSCCDAGSCDWPNRKDKKRKTKEEDVYLPPKKTIE